MSESVPPKSESMKKCGTEKDCPNPNCCNQDVSDRGPTTRRSLHEFKEGNGCPQFEPKLIGQVNMGENSVIDIKIARTGVRGNRLRTDRCAALLKNYLDQGTLDRHALRILT